ncbi:MAG: M4 family metallopeptidase [Saprospiraceae bacterium]
MKRLSYLILFLFLLGSSKAQILKEKYVFSNPNINSPEKILTKPFGNTKRNPFALDINGIHVQTASSLGNFPRNIAGTRIIERNEEGIPKVFSTDRLLFPRDKEQGAFLAEYLKSVLNISQTLNGDFVLDHSESDVQGVSHYLFKQTMNGLPIINAEYFIHSYPDQSIYGNGYAWNLPENLAVVAQLHKEQVAKICEKYFTSKNISVIDQNVYNQLRSGIKKNFLCYWQDKKDRTWHLCYSVKISPNIKENWDLIVDANTGNILEAHSNICNFAAHGIKTEKSPSRVLGAETASAVDLTNSAKTINVWKEGNTYYLIDASRPMFNAARSKFPDDPVGTIVTLDAKNRNTEGNSFSVDLISSSNNSWSNKTSVSAHINGSAAYEYFRTVHLRNSIDGVGGNILSIINVNDNGGAMDNAFWNGEAMFYGNGKNAFTPLAKGLDVAGHEMSHGVIGSTANLTYDGESGAINESYADIFGTLIDRDDWKIGEDIVITSVFKSGALRDLSDPHNGGSSLNDNGYQPRHVNEQYKGTQDNGGVHINSGIPNFAYYNFVTELSKTKGLDEAKKIGEKVYYHALTKFLTKSSNFKDLRTAIEKCSMDQYPNNPEVLAAVKFGFDKVGIGSGSSNPGSRVLQTNPGKEYVVTTDFNKQGLYIYDFQNTPVKISNRSVNSKPSVTDDGTEIYFVGSDFRLYGLFLNPNTGQYVEQILDTDPIYRNAVISKDGLLLAVVYDVNENFIHVYDFVTQKWGDFKLYNPSYSNTTTGDVQYADVMDFDHSGQFLMYDAFNTIKKTNGQNYDYWDIGFMNVFNNSGNAFATGKIEKLVAGLPDNVAIGNPVFSKNSLDVIAFDYIEEDLLGSNYVLVGANIETNDFQTIIDNRPALSYPNFSVRDNFILFDGENGNGDESINVIGLAANKIQASGNEQVLLNGGKWGAFFATGTRKLTINTKDLVSINKLEVYPNPFDSKINISINGSKSGLVKLSLLNSFGQIINSESLQIHEGTTNHEMELNELNQGIYFIKISNNEGSVTAKIIKE